MPFGNPKDETIRKVLDEAKTIAIVGLSGNPERASYEVGHYLKKQGYRVIPINPNVDEVFGEPAIASLEVLTEPVDIIDVFRRSDALATVVQTALSLSAPVIWAQLGVFDERAAEIAEQGGKTIIMDRCIKIDHHRLITKK